MSRGGSLQASGEVVEASAITLQVGGSLSAGALKLSGGALKATSGTTEVKGTIKRPSGAKVA